MLRWTLIDVFREIRNEAFSNPRRRTFSSTSSLASVGRIELIGQMLWKRKSGIKITHRERKAKIGIRRSQQYSRTQYIQRYTDRYSCWLDQHKLLQKN